MQKIGSNIVYKLESTENFSDDKTDISENTSYSQDEVNDSYHTTNADTNNSLKSELYLYS